MYPDQWEIGDIVRRTAPYKDGKRATLHGELCRVKKITPLDADRRIVIIAGNRTTGSPTDRVGKYYEWVSRGEQA